MVQPTPLPWSRIKDSYELVVEQINQEISQASVPFDPNNTQRTVMDIERFATRMGFMLAVERIYGVKHNE